MKSLLLLSASLASLALPAFAQSMPPNLRQVLRSDLRMTEEQAKQAEQGMPIAYQYDTGDPEDVFMIGVVRIHSAPASFVAKYKDVTRFEASKSVSAMGVFSTPPVVADLSRLSLAKEEIDDLHECQPGECDFKIGDVGLQRLRAGINWKAPDYVNQANRLLREVWIERLRLYQTNGNSALPSYHDTDKIFKVQDGLTAQLKKSPFLYKAVPELVDYVAKYPQAKPADTDDFFYWQVADFGLKPVHRITHVTTQKKAAQFGDAYAIASKMVFASHYFRSALEFRFLIPAQTSAGKPAFYFVILQRSYVDGLTGMKGSLIRGTIFSKTRQALENYLVLCKTKGEQ